MLTSGSAGRFRAFSIATTDDYSSQTEQNCSRDVRI